MTRMFLHSAALLVPALALASAPPAWSESKGPGNIIVIPKIGVFQVALLSEIERLGTNAYPAELARNMSSRLGRHVSIGQVFVALERLEDRGMVSCIEIPPQPVRGGRRRKLFRLEEVGRRAVREITTAILTSPGSVPAEEVFYDKQKVVA